MQACAGIRIVELCAGAGAAAYCGQLFAGLAASVSFVDYSPAPAGDRDLYLRTLLHGGKQDVAQRADLGNAITGADVVIVDQSIAGLPVELRDGALFEQRWPEKILCSISLHGAGNDRSDWVGNELIAEAAGALMACNGYPERSPVASGLPYALHTSALFAFGAIMVALREREASGKGQHIDIAIVDCIAAILGNFLPSYFLSGKTPKRIGNRHTIAAPWNLYPARDGAVVICTGTGGTGWWAKVTAVIGQAALANDPRYATEADRVRNVDEVDAIVSAWTKARAMQDIVAQMSAQAIPASEICTIEMVLADPHYGHLREMVLRDPAPDRPTIGSPLKVGAWQPPASNDRITRSTPRRSSDPAAGAPLAGLRVIEFASRTSVPLAGRLLRDFGADVVKVEPIKGDALRGAGQQIAGASYLFHINNAGKRSVMIDPAHAEGRDLILKLAGEADVFVENLAPGSVEKLGLGPGVMAALNPDLIYCSVSGFGARSAYGEKRALDTVVQAASGLMHMTGYPNHHAVKLGISAVDLATATACTAAILAGLRLKDRTGAGVRIDLAMADVGVWMTQAAWPQLICDGVHPLRLGNQSRSACPHDLFEAADGAAVAIAVESDAQWQRLASLIDDQRLMDPRLSTASGRIAQSELVSLVIGDWARRRDANAVARECQSIGIAASPLRDVAELVADPVTRERQMVVEVDAPCAGPLRLLGNPAKLSRTPPRIERAAPLLGADTAEVLREWLRLRDADIEGLAERQVILGQRLGA